MRVTNTQLTKKQAVWVKDTTEERHKAINPETKEPVSVAFSKDLFSLLDTLIPHKILKDLFQIDDEVVDGYVKKKLTDYIKVKEHYSAIRRFLREFTTTRLYQHLQGLNNPEKALEILLDMFTPKPPSPKAQQGQGQEQEDKNNKDNKNNQNQQGQDKQDKQSNQKQEQDNQDKQDQQQQQQQSDSDKSKEQEKEQSSQNQKGGGQSKNSQDQQNQSQPQGQRDSQKPKQDKQEEMDNSSDNEMSNNPPPPLMDIEDFKNKMPNIEKTLQNNPFDNDLMRQVMEKQAGLAHNSLSTIEGLAENIEQISQSIEDKEFKILDVARKVGAIQQYKREEEKSDVVYPEKDWRITNMKNISDLPKILPHQFIYPQDVFDKMMIDKDLKIKQYQSRRKKKQVLYILMDASGSMDSLKQIATAGIGIAYIKKAIEEGSIYFFRFFDSDVFDLHKVTNEKEAVKEINYLLDNPQSHGGTNIDRAIRYAIKDINNPKLFKQDAKEKNTLYDRADILVITDGEDDVDITQEELEEQKIVLHSFLLDGTNSTLQKISHTFQSLTQNEMSKLYA